MLRISQFISGATVVFVCLYQAAHLRAYALMDADPHGVDILRVYKCGASRGMAYTGTALHCKQLHWLGLLHSDATDARFKIPSSAELQLTAADVAKARGLLENPELSRVDARCESELQSMLARGTKFELEALCQSRDSIGLVAFLTAKLPWNTWAYNRAYMAVREVDQLVKLVRDLQVHRLIHLWLTSPSATNELARALYAITPSHVHHFFYG
eukprot:SAG31_NODE_2946_length_4874_cov_1.638534_4_plen_213_part_00